MRNKPIIKTYTTIFFIVFFCIAELMGQCPITVSADKISIVCGDSVNLSAKSTTGTVVFSENFNTGSPTGWSQTSNATYTNPCGAGPDATTYLWFGSSSPSPRSATTNAYNFSDGGNICFDMRYAGMSYAGSPEPTPPCENPDFTTEGVYLEYSVSMGPWTQINYWDPSGGNDPTLTVWTRYCLPIPPGAAASSVRLRWIQKVNSADLTGVPLDHWGIDNVVITLNNPTYTYDWAHDAPQGPSTSSYTPPVKPAANTTYTVTYTNGSTTCTGNISISVTKPQVTAAGGGSICSGGSILLQAVSPYQAVAPAACGLASPAKYCDPISMESNDINIGTGTIVNAYNSGTNNIFGDFGPTNSNSRMQILYRQAELTAAGLKAGRIRSLTFDIATVEDPGPYLDFSIYIGCTSKNNFASTTDFVPLASMSLVYGGTGKLQSLTAGSYVFNLDNDFDWQGTSNIVIQICYTVSGSSISCAAKTRDHNAGFVSSIQAVNNTFNYSATVCQSAVTFAGSSNNRPNIVFGNCFPKNVTMVYNWTPSGSLSSSSSRTPTASPMVATTYTVSAYANPYSQCATMANVSVDLVTPSVSISPSTATVCPPGTPNVPLTATANTNGSGTFTPVFSNTGDYAIPDNNATGISSTILVAGVTPGSMPAVLPVSVCLNITHGNDADLDISLRAPNGTIINLSDDNGGTGNNYTNTCFSTAGPVITGGAVPFTGTFTPEQAFGGLSGNINGTWTLIVKDDAAGSAGTLLDWSITFNSTTNGVTTYAWSPTTGLSNPSISNPTAAPGVTTTYTLTITDAAGCTSTSSAIIGYCVAVPLELVDFFAVKKSEQVYLSWITAMEKGTSHFIIERSSDGNTFESIGRVEAGFNSNVTKTYSFVDGTPGKEMNYYRLKSFDMNGESSYSKIISISFSGKAPFNIENISPVPAKERINCNIYSQTEVPVKLFSYDVSGRKLIEKPFLLNIGTNTIEEDVASLTSGIYLLRVQMDDGKKVIQRFIK